MLRALQAVLAAFFGVQSERNRQRDFQQSSPWPYILAGLFMAGVFVVLVLLVARWAAAS
ncbi:DUF2970 domain-containing protein [Marinospirillum alkaliphilum]|uniref:DUF2970 domain-containing protein n=1 Tax=Marinospirillum alkaliphilum DSM 21637 TaxID=1122209 RepID=A0A1K1VZ12_9GAMM|nr:DUF2970 domain-containing protein [Marinospirillum alkaliphilum]SFX30449.1 Protein of unknown function [Marinospirillum alkaliphilum DSM 21637]